MGAPDGTTTVERLVFRITASVVAPINALLRSPAARYDNLTLLTYALDQNSGDGIPLRSKELFCLTTMDH